MKKLMTFIMVAVAAAVNGFAGRTFEVGSWTTDPSEVVESDDSATRVVLYQPIPSAEAPDIQKASSWGFLYDGDITHANALGTSNIEYIRFSDPVHIEEIRVYSLMADGNRTHSDIQFYNIIPVAADDETGAVNVYNICNQFGVGATDYSGSYGASYTYLGDTATGNRYVIYGDTSGMLMAGAAGLYLDVGLLCDGVTYLAELEIKGRRMMEKAGGAMVGTYDASAVDYVKGEGTESWTFTSNGRFKALDHGLTIAKTVYDGNGGIVSSESLGRVSSGTEIEIAVEAGSSVVFSATSDFVMLGSALAGSYDGSQVVYSSEGDTESWTFSSDGKLQFDGYFTLTGPDGSLGVTAPGQIVFTSAGTYTATPFETEGVGNAVLGSLDESVKRVDVGVSEVLTFSETGRDLTFTLSEGGFVKLLLVGGGGGGGGTIAGGGGAGGFLYFDQIYLAAGTHTVRVGAGGTGGTEGLYAAQNGGDTTLDGIVAFGGGGGGNYNYHNNESIADLLVQYGQDGGSGGGDSNYFGNPRKYSSGKDGQGFGGGYAFYDIAGGGGGAGEPGGNAVPGGGTLSGRGGDGLPCDITGETVWYAGGGGGGSGGCGEFGGSTSVYGGRGGKGGGGAGSVFSSYLPGNNGVNGFGGGGGGGCSPATSGGSGGSGIAIISILKGDLTDDIPDVERGEIICDGTDVSFSYRLFSFGGAEDTACFAEISYGLSADNLDRTIDLGEVADLDKHTVLIEGLSEATTYYVNFTLTSNKGGQSVSTGVFAVNVPAVTDFSHLDDTRWGLWEVRTDGSSADDLTDPLTIKPGSAATERHLAAVPSIFYTHDSYVNPYTGETYSWTGEPSTWIYKGYLYLADPNEWAIVARQMGSCYCKLDGTVLWDWTQEGYGYEGYKAFTKPDPKWYPVEFRIGTLAEGNGAYDNGLQLSICFTSQWNWLPFDYTAFRYYLGNPFTVANPSRKNDEVRAELTFAADLRGAKLYVRHGKLGSWSVTALNGGEPIDGQDKAYSFTVESDDLQYQFYAVKDDIEYPELVHSLAEVRAVSTEKPELTVVGVSSITPVSAAIDFELLSAGGGETADVIIRYGTLAEELCYEAVAENVAVGVGSAALAGLVPESVYYYSLTPVGEGEVEGVTTAIASFTTGADSAGTFVADSEHPQIASAFSLDGVGGDQVVLNGWLLSAGGDSAAVTIRYGTDSTLTDYSTFSVGSLAGDAAVDAVIDGLTPGSDYYFRIVAESASGEWFSTPVRSVRAKGTATIDQAWAVVNYGVVEHLFTLSDLGAGDSVVVALWLDGEKVNEMTVTERGNNKFVHQFDKLGGHSFKITVSNQTAGGETIVGESETIGYALTQNNCTFHWIGGASGLWSDSTNWSVPEYEATGVVVGCPNCLEAVVTFADAGEKVVIGVDGAYEVAKIVPGRADCELVFTNAAVDASLAIKYLLMGDDASGEYFASTGSSFCFEDMTVYLVSDPVTRRAGEFAPMPGGRFVLRRSTMQLREGCDPWFGYFTLRYPNSSLELYEGSSLVIPNDLQIHSQNTKVIIDDSTVDCGGLQLPIFPTDRNNTIEFYGKSPKCIMRFGHVGAQGGANDGSSGFVFHVPAGGYESVPVELPADGITMNGWFDYESNPFRVKIADDSSCFGKGKLEAVDLISWPSSAGMRVENVILDAGRRVNDVSFDYLYTGRAATGSEGETPKYLTFTYNPKGLVIFVK